MSFDINQQMQANLAHFYIMLKQSDQIIYQDIQGNNFEGKVQMVQPKEQKILLSNQRNLQTLEQSNFRLIQFKEITYLKINNNCEQERNVSKSEKKEKTFIKFDQVVTEQSLEDQKKTPFDQFEAMKKFGLEPTFNEQDYTTQIKIQINDDLKKYAEQHELELKKESKQENKHVLEERNLKELDDNDNEDEELKYSSVIREQQQEQQQKLQYQQQQLGLIQQQENQENQQHSNTPQQLIQEQPQQQQIQESYQQFYNSKKQKDQKPIQLIQDVDEFNIETKLVNQAKETKFKLNQCQNCDIQKQLISNYMKKFKVYK